jgi:hypothetical protein
MAMSRPGVASLALLLLLLVPTGGVPVDPSPAQTTQPASAVDQAALTNAMVRFARAPSAATAGDLSFTDQVSLGLGKEVLVQRASADLVNPDNWITDAGPAGFRERSGPFSALDVLAEAGQTVAATGPYESCNRRGEFAPAPVEFGDHARISIQPDPSEVGTCMQWWSVDLYVTPAGEIAAVMLDFGAP